MRQIRATLDRMATLAALRLFAWVAHSQFPGGAGIGFGPDWGSDGPGPYQILGPPGRLLDAHDANTLNVLIPLEEIDSYTTYNGNTITVQSLATGQVLGLHVVGEYVTAGGTKTPFFGKKPLSSS